MLEKHRIKLNKRILFASLLLGLTSAPGYTADWRLTAMRHTEFGVSLSFIDAQSIRGGNGHVEFSTLTFFDRQTRKMNRVSTSVTADCPSKTYRFQKIILFEDQQPLSQWHSTVTAMAMPRSNVFDSISSACGISNFGMHVEDAERFAVDYFKKSPQRSTRPA